MKKDVITSKKLTREEAFKVYIDSLPLNYVSFLIATDENMEKEKRKFDIIWDLMPKIYTMDGGK